MEARKLTFQEVWDSSQIFFVDADLEAEIDQKVTRLLELANDQRVAVTASIEVPDIAAFLASDRDTLDVVLRDIELSDEKFMRIVSLLRKIGRIQGGFDREWSIDRIKSTIQNNPEFRLLIAHLLVDGNHDAELARYIPQYYLETLNYREIRGGSTEARKVRYKRSLIGTYGGRKGYKVEDCIRQQLQAIQDKHGISFAQGRSRLIETDIDFAIPSVEDPWVIIMSSFQETTSSGQTTKARDMLAAYERIGRNNNRYNETRAFVNFVDGGGWLARKRDLERLVENCHYFVNLAHLPMLEAIVLKHVPRTGKG